MIPAPPSPDEPNRLAALRASGLLDLEAEAGFDDLAALASQICETPIALVSLVDEDRQWFKARVGLGATETPRTLAFCAHAILADDPLVVPDSHVDERFHDNPLVTGAPHVRFYAGTPLTGPSGHKFGTLCVIDHEPRELNPLQLRALEALGRQVEAQIVLRERLRDALELSDAKDHLLSMVSHELRTPLSGIKGAIGLVMGGVGGEIPPKAMDLLRTATESSDRLVRLVNDFLDLAKLDVGAVRFKRTPVRGNDIIRPTIELMGPVAARSNVAVRASGVDREVLVDTDRITQVLVNLLGNALAFAPEGSDVHVRCLDADGYLRFEVVDNGPGISEVDRQRIFGRFEQVDGSAARRHSGTGLGLAISKAIVEKHGGTIGVDSTLGEGSTFWFTIPAPPEDE